MDPDLRDIIIVFGIGGIIVVVYFLNQIGKSGLNGPTKIEQNKEYPSYDSEFENELNDEDHYNCDESNKSDPYYESDEDFINRLMSDGKEYDYDNDPAYKDFPKIPPVDNKGKGID